MLCSAALQAFQQLWAGGTISLTNELASNAVLEWNGVTVKGMHKIVKFLRQKQYTGMVQSFSNAVTVEPFEERDTHFSTKTTPPENLISTSVSDNDEIKAVPEQSSPSTNTNEMDTLEDLSYETPPRTLPAALHPPPLTAGRQFIPLSSDEDDSDASNLSPPAQSRCPTSCTVPTQNMYSELHYLEAIGTLRTGTEPKHRGTRTTHHIPREDASVHSSSDDIVTTPPTPRRRSNCIGSRSKLKLSYRTHRYSGDFQFALIIYEHITTRSSTVRRNLFSDPQPVELSSEQQQASSPTHCPRLDLSPQPTPLPVTPPEESPPAQETSAAVQTTSRRTPPGTPIKRRRPIMTGFRTSPRRARPPVEDYSFAAGASSSSSVNNLQQICSRKTQSTDRNVGGSAAKSRKLSTTTCTVSSTVRKPLRF